MSDDPRRGVPPTFPFPFPFPPVVQDVRVAPVGLWSAVFGGFFLALGVLWTLGNLGYLPPGIEAWQFLPLFFTLVGVVILWSSYSRRKAIREFWRTQLPPR
ncbi:MAG TPA: hypothetical protein VM681_11385 [Candidatus Thermoplasmatota archaeon]|nr:hypothetical protein [Candidatus Thermoplasmatota archaeon]